MISERKYDLEDRLIKFAIMALEVCELLPNSRAANNLEYQLSKKWDSLQRLCMVKYKRPNQGVILFIK